MNLLDESGVNMYQIDLHNCNNIKEGSIVIHKGKLNIKYGINGTGKTTLAKAICNYNTDILNELKSFLTDDDPIVNISEKINNIVIFNEEFVNKFVFVKDEVIPNAFQIFINVEDYEKRKKLLDEQLDALHKSISENKAVLDLKEMVDSVAHEFTLNKNKTVAKKGAFKSILNKENIYTIPKELKVYTDFLQDTTNNINWIDWKNKGVVFDKIDKCPYCADELTMAHKKRNDTFKNVYKKTEAQKLKDLCDWIEKVKLYIESNKYNELIDCIKIKTDEDVIQKIIYSFVLDVNFLTNRLNKILDFGNKGIVNKEINNLEEEINGLYLHKVSFHVFSGDEFDSIINPINLQLDRLVKDVRELKIANGKLSGWVKSVVENSKDDINRFLNIAGIRYEIDIKVEDDKNFRTILKEKFSVDDKDVNDIDKHLSWGERNAFALVLFMYYALSQNPDLIILDDPISSFDYNKKYAIFHRLFIEKSNRNKTFKNSTVLLLTHDFEPVTDTVGIDKDVNVSAKYIWNDDGKISEKDITHNDIHLLTKQCKDILCDDAVNRISKVAFLRKLLELELMEGDKEVAYQILSSLIHNNPPQRKEGRDKYSELKNDEIVKGMKVILSYINDFNYDTYLSDMSNVIFLIELYENEDNKYFKLQIFRQISEVVTKGNLLRNNQDDAWFKFIDETYHIENDILYYLDIKKFDIVPSYVIKLIDEKINLLKNNKTN